MGDIFYEKTDVPDTQKKEENFADIRETARLQKTSGTPNIALDKLVATLSKAERERIFSEYDAKSLAVVFEDKEMMRTAKAFLSCGMNISETARILYMHRNTLMYRLNSIKKRTGLNLKNFDAAVTFEILHILYLLK